MINYRMRITLTDGRQMTGQMLAFDKHMNLVLADTEEFRRVKRKPTKAQQAPGQAPPTLVESEEKRTLGLTIVRGTHIVSCSVDGPPPSDPSARLGTSAPGGATGAPLDFLHQPKVFQEDRHLREQQASNLPDSSHLVKGVVFLQERFTSPIFLDFRQKAISLLLTVLWQGNHFQARWTVLAKVYSKIRDQQGKDNADLSKFLELVTPFIGIIASAEYLSTRGLQMTEGEWFCDAVGTLDRARKL
ncbi:MAG: hypothetical protein Q9157_001066 [Trypethelium eluteriae]